MTRYPFDQNKFMTFYSQIWTEPPERLLTEQAVHKLPLVFIVLALSALIVPLQVLKMGRYDDGLPVDRTEYAHELYLASRHSAAISDGFNEGQNDKNLILADLLTSRYLILVRRAGDGPVYLASALNKAYGIALHRQASMIEPEIDKVEEEERRLLWR